MDRPTRLSPTLLIGDALAILLFAALGRVSHGMELAPAAVVATAFPFWAAWFGVGFWLRALREEAVHAPFSAWKKAALTWLLAWPIALQLRVLLTGRPAPFSFAANVFAINLLFLSGWRTIYAWAKGRRQPSDAKVRT